MIDIAYSGIHAAKEAMQHITNNIVSSKQEGYQGIHSFFVNLPPQKSLTSPSASSPTSVNEPRLNDVSIGSGIREAGKHRDLSLGSLQQTNDPLHLAINGLGYFRVENAQGEGYRYTRNGRFSIDANTRQLTRGGDVLSDNIIIPEDIKLDSIKILEDGRVQGIDDRNEVQDLGQIMVYTLLDANVLEDTGNGLLKYPSNFGIAAIPEEAAITANIPGTGPAGALAHKALESSNVNIEAEMLQMNEYQRMAMYCYEVIRALNKLDDTAIASLRV